MSYSIAGNDSFGSISDFADNLPFLNISNAKVDNLTVQTLISDEPSFNNLTISGNLTVDGVSTLNELIVSSLNVDGLLTVGNLVAGNVDSVNGNIVSLLSDEALFNNLTANGAVDFQGSFSALSASVVGIINCASLSVTGSITGSDGAIITGDVASDTLTLTGDANVGGVLNMASGFTMANSPAALANTRFDWGAADGVICAASASAAGTAVVFDTAFSAAPNVVISLLSGTQSALRLNVSLTSVSASGFTWNVFNSGASSTTAEWSLQYYVVGPV